MHRYWIAALLLMVRPALAEDLMEIYRQAQASDPVFAGARARHAAGIERLPQGRALLLPNVNLSASRTENDQRAITPTLDAEQRFSADSYGLTLIQPLYRKQNFASYAQSGAQAQEAEFEFEAARQNLILRIAEAYFGALAAQDTHDYSVREKTAIERILALARRNFSVGTANLVDVHEAEARLDAARAQEIVAATDLEAKRETLRALTGQAPGPLTRLKRLDPRAPEPADPEKWADVAQRENPTVRARDQTLVAAREEIEKNRAGHYPTLDLTAGRTFSDGVSPFSGTRLETTNNQIGLLLQVPLYQGGATFSKVREAAARRDEAASRLDLAKREATQLARQSYLSVLNGVARVKALEQALRSNQRALETTILGYERGSRTGVDVLNTQRDLFRTRRDLTAARYEYLFNHLRLLSAAGQLEDAALEDLNRQLGDNPIGNNGKS